MVAALESTINDAAAAQAHAAVEATVIERPDRLPRPEQDHLLARQPDADGPVSELLAQQHRMPVIDRCHGESPVALGASGLWPARILSADNELRSMGEI
jgi:hypothetical protein